MAMKRLNIQHYADGTASVRQIIKAGRRDCCPASGKCATEGIA